VLSLTCSDWAEHSVHVESILVYGISLKLAVHSVLTYIILPDCSVLNGGCVVTTTISDFVTQWCPDLRPRFLVWCITGEWWSNAISFGLLLLETHYIHCLPWVRSSSLLICWPELVLVVLCIHYCYYWWRLWARLMHYFKLMFYICTGMRCYTLLTFHLDYLLCCYLLWCILLIPLFTYLVLPNTVLMHLLLVYTLLMMHFDPVWPCSVTVLPIHTVLVMPVEYDFLRCSILILYAPLFPKLINNRSCSLFITGTVLHTILMMMLSLYPISHFCYSWSTQVDFCCQLSWSSHLLHSDLFVTFFLHCSVMMYILMMKFATLLLYNSTFICSCCVDLFILLPWYLLHLFFYPVFVLLSAEADTASAGYSAGWPGLWLNAISAQ